MVALFGDGGNMWELFRELFHIQVGLGAEFFARQSCHMACAKFVFTYVGRTFCSSVRHELGIDTRFDLALVYVATTTLCKIERRTCKDSYERLTTA